MTPFLLVAVCCSKPVPTSIGPEEYEIYSAWLSSRLVKAKPMPDLFIESRTFPARDFLPSDSRCGKSERLMDPLLALGDAAYRLDRAPAFTVPFDYRFVDERPKDAVNPFRIVSFSRIALNHSHSEGVFAVSDSRCSAVEVASKRALVCGGGRSGFVHAYRTKQHVWHFEPAKDCPVTVE